jgi:hypothetical protein
MPDVDWLIRSETSPDEAFDIEVTGGWVTFLFFILASCYSREPQERSFPITIPDPPGRSEEDNPTTILPPHEDALIPPEEAQTPVSFLNSVPTVGIAGQEPFHLSQDAPPLSVTAKISSVEAQGIGVECPSTVEDKDSLALGISSLSGSTPSSVDDKDSLALNIFSSSGSIPPLAEAIPPSVNPASSFLEPFMPPEESEPASASGTSSPEQTVPMAAESACSQDEAVHTEISCAHSSANPPTLPTDSTVASASSGMHTPLKDAPADDTKASQPPVRLAFVRPESTILPNRTELALASSAPTSEETPEPARPQAEASRPADHLMHSTFDSPMPSVGENVDPASVVPTRSRTTTPDGTLSQAEVAHRPSISPKPPMLTSTAPILNHTALAPAPASTTPLRSKPVRPEVQPVRCPEHLVPPMENRSTFPSGVPAPETIRSFPGRARSGSRSEIVRQPLVVEFPPALSASPRAPTPPLGRKRVPLTGVTQAPHVSLPPLECVRKAVETARPPNQNSSASSKSRVSSALAGVPTFHRTAQPSERTHVRVESQTPHPPVRRPQAPPPSGPRTSIGSQLPSSNGVPVSDVNAVHLSSRSRIKSHPKKMVTSAGQRRSGVFSTQIAVQPAAQPSSLPVGHSTANLGPNYASASQLHTALVGSQYHGEVLENRGGYQSYATRQGQVNVSISVSTPATSNSTTRTSSQDHMGQSRRSTVVAGPVSPFLSSPRPAEKSVPGTVRNRNSLVPVARQDRTAGALSHSSHTKSSNLAAIPEGQGALKGYAAARSATPTISRAAAEKPNSPSSQSSNISRTSQLATRLQPIVSPVPSSSNFSDPVTTTRLGNPPESLSHNSWADMSSGVAGTLELRGEFRGYSVGPKVLPLPPLGGGTVISASPVWNSTSRTPSRIKTKDLISRHKQQNMNDVRRSSAAESASPSKAPTSALSQTATLVGKPSANRIDSGIVVWDYDPQGTAPDRRRAPDTSTNGHGNLPRDRGPSSLLPTSSPISIKNTNNREDGTGASLSSKISRMSMLGSPSPAVSLSQSGIPTSCTPPPEQVKNPLLNVTTVSSSTGSLTSTVAGRREPFINRKPQPTTQSTSQGGATPQSGFSTPPRSTTPSSISHSGSTSTRGTVVTPATSFTIPSRVPSPVAEVGSKSWFRRNVIDPFKSKLGYGS